MTIKKAMEIFGEKDPEKRKKLIDALPEKEKEAYLQEADRLQKDGAKIAEEGKRLSGR